MPRTLVKNIGKTADAADAGLVSANTLGKDLTTAPAYDGVVPGDSLITSLMLAAGAVVQYTTNADGTAYRFESGLQVCIRSIPGGNLTVSTATGAMFRSADQIWTFPLAFTGSPFFGGFAYRSAAASNIFAYVATQGGIATTYVDYNVVATVSIVGSNWIRRLFAIGTWK